MSVFVAWPVGLLMGEWHVAPWHTAFWLRLWRAAQWEAVFLSYLMFGWAGCAMAILPGRWPAYPRSGEGVRLSTTRQSLSVFAVWATVAAMIWLMVVHGDPWVPFFCLFFVLAVVPLPLAAVLFLLVPWPAWRFIPRLPELPAARGMHPCAVTLILSIWAAYLPLSHSLRGYALYVWTGRFFTSDDLMTGSALDQPSLQKAFFVSAWFAVMSMAVIAATRWLSNRRSRFGYFANAIPAALIGLVHLSAHATPLGFTLKYLFVMGPTPKRIAGVFYGALGYVILIVFLTWALWPPVRRDEPDE